MFNRQEPIQRRPLRTLEAECLIYAEWRWCRDHQRTQLEKRLLCVYMTFIIVKSVPNGFTFVEYVLYIYNIYKAHALTPDEQL